MLFGNLTKEMEENGNCDELMYPQYVMLDVYLDRHKMSTLERINEDYEINTKFTNNDLQPMNYTINQSFSPSKESVELWLKINEIHHNDTDWANNVE